MNTENINKAIAVMERVKKRCDVFDLSDWQWSNDVCQTEEELHKCGTSACFAGWVGISPEFIKDGGSINANYGYPIIKEHAGVEAMAYWLDISDRLAANL